MNLHPHHYTPKSENNLEAVLIEMLSLLKSNMAVVRIPPKEVLTKELRHTTLTLSSAKLYQGAKWASELLVSINSEAFSSSNDPGSLWINEMMVNNLDMEYRFDEVYQGPTGTTFDTVMLASTLFDLREYKKAAQTLHSSIPMEEATQDVMFLVLYSLFLYGEQRKEEEYYENASHDGHTSKEAVNQEAGKILKHLESPSMKGNLNAMNLYLYGVILKDLKRNEEAISAFVASLNKMPCFWTCWLELCRLISDENLKAVFGKLRNHWMKNFWVGSFFLEKFKFEQCIEINSVLLCFFRKSNYIYNQIAHAFYNQQDYDNSLEWFGQLLRIDPFRYENLDTYFDFPHLKKLNGKWEVDVEKGTQISFT